MTPLKATNFRLDQEMLDALHAIKTRDGVSVSEQVRRAIQMWVEAKGVTKSDRKRAITRKRP